MQKGDADAAIAWLKSIPQRFLPRSLEKDPIFAPIQNRPDFKALFQTGGLTATLETRKRAGLSCFEAPRFPDRSLSLSETPNPDRASWDIVVAMRRGTRPPRVLALGAARVRAGHGPVQRLDPGRGPQGRPVLPGRRRLQGPARGHARERAGRRVRARRDSSAPALKPGAPNGSFVQTTHLMVATLGARQPPRGDARRTARARAAARAGLLPAAVQRQRLGPGAAWSTPDSASTRRSSDYDDYGDRVKGRIALILEHEPGERDPNSPFDGVVTAEAAVAIKKVLAAQEKGAVGVLFVTDVHNHPGPQNFEAAARAFWPPEPPRIDRFTLASWADRVRIPVGQVSPALAEIAGARHGALAARTSRRRRRPRAASPACRSTASRSRSPPPSTATSCPTATCSGIIEGSRPQAQGRGRDRLGALRPRRRRRRRRLQRRRR